VRDNEGTEKAIMTTLQYNILTGANGSIVIPATPFPFGKEVEVVLRMPKEKKHSEQTEERKAAGKKFFDTWDGLLEGMPDMTAKEIRAERLEGKYGQ
jgi:hypothetical protein